MTSKSSKGAVRKNSGAALAKAHDRKLLVKAAREDAEGFGTLRAQVLARPHGSLLVKMLDLSAELDSVGDPICQAVAVGLATQALITLSARTGFEYRAQLGMTMTSIAQAATTHILEIVTQADKPTVQAEAGRS